MRVRRQPDRLRRHRGADAGAHLVHAGARRAALPVAQGDHGRAVQGDRRPGRWRTSASTRRRSVARSPRRGSLAVRGAAGPRPPPASCASRPPEAAAAGRRVPRRAEAHLMGADPGRRRGRRRTARLARIGTEVATLARDARARRAGARSAGWSSRPTRSAAAAELAALPARGQASIAPELAERRGRRSASRPRPAARGRRRRSRPRRRHARGRDIAGACRR